MLLSLAQALVEKKGPCDNTEGLMQIMQVCPATNMISAYF